MIGDGDFEVNSEPANRPPVTPMQQMGLLIRSDPAKSSLQECIETINDLKFAVASADRIDAGLVRELRVWQERRLELEDRVSREGAAMFFPPDMQKAELIEHLHHLLELAEELPDER